MTQHHHSQRRALRTRPRGGDDAARHLQGNNNKEDKSQPTTPPTFAPTMSPTKKPTTQEVVMEGSVSLGWSLLLENNQQSLSDDTREVEELLKHWITQEFLCFQDNVWLTSDLKTLDSDCQSTIRRRLQETNNPDDRTILLNDPVVLETPKTLSDFRKTEYTMWNIEYPIYSYGDSSNEKETFEEMLQDVLNEEINEESLVWEDGILAVVGDEMDVFRSTNHYWKTDDNYAILALGPISVTPLQALGATIAVAQTISLILLHIFVTPYLRDRYRKKQQRKDQETSAFLPSKEYRSPSSSLQQRAYDGRSPSSHSHSHHRNQESSRTKHYTQRDFIPSNISIPERPQSESGSSAAYPIPY